MKLNYRHTLEATLAIKSIRNKTQSDISRCCAARLQFIKKGHQPPVLGAATLNGYVSIKGLKPIRRPSITCLSRSKAAGSRGSVVKVKSDRSSCDTTLGPIKTRTLSDLSVLSNKGIDGSCKGISRGYNVKKRGFGTLVLEKVHKLILVFPYLLEQLFPELLIGFSGIGVICSLYFLDRNNVLSFQTLKPTLNPQTIYTRRYILIIFEIAGNSQMDENEILERLLRLFVCESIIVGKEPPIGDNRCIHIHVGVSNRSASKNTFRAHIRKAFPELKKEQLNIIARKSWTPIFQSVERVADTFIIWKNGTPPTVIVKEKQAYASQQKQNPRERNTIRKEKEREGMANQNPTRRVTVTSKELFALLSEKESWGEVVHDPILGPRLINNYLNIRNVYVDLRISKMEKELEEKGLQLFARKVFLFCYRVIYLDKTLVSRLTIISLTYLIFGSLAFLFGGLEFIQEFVIDLLQQEPKSGSEPGSKPTLNQQPSSPKDSTVNTFTKIIIAYIVIRILLAGNH